MAWELVSIDTNPHTYEWNPYTTRRGDYRTVEELEHAYRTRSGLTSQESRRLNRYWLSNPQTPLRRPYRGFSSLRHPDPIQATGFDTTSLRNLEFIDRRIWNRNQLIRRLRGRLRRASFEERLELNRRIQELLERNDRDRN